jgi:signal transduction histidine kinase
MIYFLILLNLLFILVFCAAILFLFFKYFKLAEEKARNYSYLRKAINTITAVRYGNLQARVEEGHNEILKRLSHKLNDMFESISDREDMVQEYIAKEKEANLLKADFIATLTHDLKVPIIAQDNTFELFLSGKFGELSEIQKDALKKLKISNMDLKHLVDALLETFKMEQARIEVKKSENLSNLIN